MNLAPACLPPALHFFNKYCQKTFFF